MQKPPKRLLLLLLYLTNLTTSTYLSFYIERSPSSNHDYLNLFLSPTISKTSQKITYKIPKITASKRFKIRICPENYQNKSECKQDRFNTIAYIDELDSQSLYQIGIKDKYKLCGFGMGFFEAQKSFLKLIVPENEKSFEKNLEGNGDLIFTEAPLIMANVKLADEMNYSDFLNFSGFSKCVMDFEVRDFTAMNFSHQFIRFVSEEDFDFLEIFYNDESSFNFNDDFNTMVTNYKMYFDQFDQRENLNLADAKKKSNDKIETLEVERELKFSIGNNLLNVITEETGCEDEKEDANREVNNFNLEANVEISFVPMICSNKNENSIAEISALNSEKCELFNSESNFVIKNNRVYKDGIKLGSNFILKDKVIESKMSKEGGDFDNYFYSRCGLMKFCDEIYDSQNKVLYIRCFSKELIIKTNSKEEIVNTFEIRKDNNDNQFKEISFVPNLDRRRILTRYKMADSKYYYGIGILMGSIAIWAFLTISIPGLIIAIFCVLGTMICCGLGEWSKGYKELKGKSFEFEIDDSKVGKRRKRRRILAGSSNFLKKIPKEDLLNYKNKILSVTTNIEQKLLIFQNTNKEFDPSYANSIMFYTQIGQTFKDYQKTIVPDLKKWTAEEESFFNFSEKISEGSDNINKKQNGSLMLPKGIQGGNNKSLFQGIQIPDHISNKPDNSMNMLYIQRIKPRKKNFGTGRESDFESVNRQGKVIGRNKVVESRDQGILNENFEDSEEDGGNQVGGFEGIQEMKVRKKNFII